jgi:hypothetical protein
MAAHGPSAPSTTSWSPSPIGMGEELKRIVRPRFLTRSRGRGTTKWWRGRCLCTDRSAP